MTQVTLQQIKDAVANRFAASRLTERSYEDIVRLANRYLAEGKRPLHVYCIATGSKCAMTAKALFAKRMDECDGDIVCLLTSYLGRGYKPSKVGGSTKPEKHRKPKKEKLAKLSKTDQLDTIDPADLPDPYRHYKILIGGEWKYWWNDPQYQAEWRKSRDNPKQLTIQDWIDMLKNTCHRVDISCAGPCNACPFVYICSCKCKVVVDRAGKKLEIDPNNMTTFDEARADLDASIHRLRGSKGVFDTLTRMVGTGFGEA